MFSIFVNYINMFFHMLNNQNLIILLIRCLINIGMPINKFKLNWLSVDKSLHKLYFYFFMGISTFPEYLE